jgi:hypothetical protein
LVHAPGKLHESPWWEPVQTAVFGSTATYISPPSLGIVTWNSGAPDSILSVRGHTLGWFERSVAHIGLEATVLGGDIGSAWTNRHKLDLTIDFLSHTTHRYVLGADSSDALLVGDPHAMLERYLRLGAPMLFNAEKNFWPPELGDLRAFEDRIGRGPFRYLNSGAWLGRREACLEAFRAAKRWAERLAERPTSDQICWKHAYRELHPMIAVDDGCAVFQNLNRVRREIRVQGQSLPLLTAWGLDLFRRP